MQLNVKEEAKIAGINPDMFIERLEDGYARCTNPAPYETMQSITIRTHFTKEKGEAFKRTIEQMVEDRTLSPRFSQIILYAAGLL